MKKPRRAFVLTLELSADSRRDLSAALRQLAMEIDREMISNGVWGGYSSGGIYDLNIDESITHDIYAQRLNDYLEGKVAELTIDDIEVGKTYQGKFVKFVGPKSEPNDRTVIRLSPLRHMVTYTSPAVYGGRPNPSVSMRKFLAWASHEVKADDT